MVSPDIYSNLEQIKYDYVKPWKLLRISYAISRLLAAVALVIGLSVFVGYWLGLEWLYHPLRSAPAINPVTALLGTMLSLGLLFDLDHSKRRAIKLLSLICAVLSVLVIIDHVLNTKIIANDLFFSKVVQADIKAAIPNEIGFNTSLMFLLLSLSLLFQSFSKTVISQFIAFISIAIPTLSLVGYVYELSDYYAHMSLYTAALGTLLGWATLLRTAGSGGLRAVLSPHLAGKIARIQAILGILIPFAIGLILISRFSQQIFYLFGLFVIFTNWLFVLIISISAVQLEKSDRERRKTARLLVQLATTDPLTGLLNRRQFFESLEHELARSDRENLRVWILMIDIDNFKRINDNAGHSVGDLVLVQLANVLSSSTRKSDLVCRFGGEEFCVLLSEEGSAGVRRVCQHIVQSTREMEIEGWTDTHGPVTISVGVSRVDSRHGIRSSLLQADEAMYKSKVSGKDRITYAFQR